MGEQKQRLLTIDSCDVDECDYTRTIVELVEFLTTQTRSDIRRKALEYVVGYSGTIDGPTARLFTNNDFTITEAICKLCETSVSDRSEALCILTNCSSESAEVADFILSRSRCAQLAFDASRSHERYMDFAAHLLANLSRHFPDRVNDALVEYEPNHLDILVELFSSSPEISFACLIGYTLVNLSTLCSVRYQLVDLKRLSRVCSLTVVEKKKEVAADILRNLAFEDALHSTLVDDESDMYLVSLLIPLADCSDKLSDDEIEKLPLRLQYYEGTREKSVQMRQKLIEALYQLCSTRTSREYLRKRGVYALLRELDEATEEDTHQKSHTGWTGGGVKLLTSQQEHTLHALIAVLIRDEDEISRDSNFESLRSLS